MKSTEVKFCEKSAPGDRQDECREAVKGLMSSRDQKEMQGYLEEISQITGKDPQEVAETLVKSCPLCPEDEKH